jgi:hypothetical protein
LSHKGQVQKGAKGDKFGGILPRRSSMLAATKCAALNGYRLKAPNELPNKIKAYMHSTYTPSEIKTGRTAAVSLKLPSFSATA